MEFEPEKLGIESVTADEALVLLDQMQGLYFSTVQEQILRRAIAGQTYRRMAQQMGYETDYLKYVGSKLWQELSTTLGQPVSKSNVRAVLHQLQRQQNHPSGSSFKCPSKIACDWGDAPVLQSFYGRQRDLAQLKQWCVVESCRLVMLQGQGGIGKTTLARQLAQQFAEGIAAEQDKGFERIVWRSLRSAPTPLEFLKDSVLALDPLAQDTVFSGLSDGLALLLRRLSQRRYFIVLDNSESLLRSQSLTGQYLPGYEGYQAIFEQLVKEPHQSCIVLTGRELPAHFTNLQAHSNAVQIYPVESMALEACRSLVGEIGVNGQVDESAVLCDRYSGNPLSLKLVASTIRDLFNGQIQPFLASGIPLLGGVQQVLDQQFERFLPLEQQVMDWLAIYREPMPLDELKHSFLHLPDMAVLIEALDSLWRRSLLEKVVSSDNTPPRFTQQPVIMEYVTRRLIERVVVELNGVTTSTVSALSRTVLNRYSLLTPAAPDYVCNAQKRLILQTILARLLQQYGSPQAVEQQLRQWIKSCHDQLSDCPGYAAGNGVNLLCWLKGTVENLDCSGLALWRMDLRGCGLQHSNLKGADLQSTRFTETFGSVLCVAIDATGQQLATGDTNGEIRIWDIRTGQIQQTFSGHSSWVRSLCFHPSQPWLVSASNDHTLKVWAIATGACLHTLTGHRHWVRDVTVVPFPSSASPRLASCDADGIICLWDCKTWRCVQRFVAHDQAVRSLAAHPAGYLLSGSEDGTLKLWDLNTEHCLRTFVGHTAAVYSVQFAIGDESSAEMRGDRIISGSADGEIRVWDSQTGKCLHTLIGHDDAVWDLSLSAEGQHLASGSADSTIRIWEWQTGQCLRVLPGHHHWVLSVAFLPTSQPEQRLVSGGYDQTVRLWESTIGKPLQIWQGYTNGIFALTFDAHSGELVSGSQDGQVRIWHRQTEQCHTTIPAHTAQVWCIALSDDGQWLASGGLESTIYLWHRATGKCHARLDAGTYWVRSLAFSPDGRWLVSVGAAAEILLWDLTTATVERSLSGHSAFAWAVAFSPDGQWLASCSNDATVRLWDWRTGECQHVLHGHKGPVESLVFSPDGQWLASAGGDGIIRLWSVAGGQSIAECSGHTDQIGRLAISATGRWIASMSNDQTVKVWDSHTQRCIHSLTPSGRGIGAIAFAPHPQVQLLVCGDLEGQFQVWDCDKGVYVQQWSLPRPYEGLDLTYATGLTPAQWTSLQHLGAIGNPLPKRIR